MPSPKELISAVYSQANLKRIDSDYRKYKVYNGQLRQEIKDAISREFILPETVRELEKRIIPVNITQKVINKLAQVYTNAPERSTVVEDEQDRESLNLLALLMRANQVGKTTNRYFKLHKGVLNEPYLNSKGIPSLRTVESYAFTQFSEDPIDPTRPTHTIKHLNMVGQRKDHLHVVWSDEEHYTMDGEGNVLDNPGNPYGVNPLVYIKEGECLMPIPDDDLYFLQIAICLLLTDLAFASKYQAWSIIYLIGVETQKLSFNPNSIVTLPKNPDGSDPQIGTIKPTLDSGSLLQQVEALIGLLMTTKNLSVGTVTMSLEGGGSVASGVSKMLDQSETTEDQQDQRQYFIDAETELWTKVCRNMMSVWVESGQIDPTYALSFSDQFIPVIRFQDSKPPMSKKELVDTLKVEKDAGFITLEMALKELHPEASQEEIDQMIINLNQEELDRLNGFEANNQRTEINQ